VKTVAGVPLVGVTLPSVNVTLPHVAASPSTGATDTTNEAVSRATSTRAPVKDLRMGLRCVGKPDLPL
jgi:hypothetical protein